MLRAGAIAGFLALAGAATAFAQPTAAPETLGFSADGLAALDAYFAEQADAGVRAGFVIGVARNGEVVHALAVGLADVATVRPMALDTRFRLASMTKPVTVVAVLTLVEDGVIDLDEPVSVHIPTMANMLVATSQTRNAEGGFDVVPPATPMTIRHLLTHTSGLGYALAAQSDLDREYLAQTLYDGEGDLAQSIDQLTYLPLYFEPGDHWSYSWSMDVLGRVVEVASGMAFEDFLKTEIFEPLGMTSTHFFREPADADLLATVYMHDEDGALVPAQRIVFGSGDETWPSGGGGLISTVPDYLKFAAMLAGGGALGEVRILEPETVSLMGSPQLQPSQFPPDGATLLGWSPEGRNFGFGVQVTTDAELTPQQDRDGDFGWNGAYQTDWFASPSTGVAAVIMLQSAGGPNRPPLDVGGDLRRLVYGALAED